MIIVGHDGAFFLEQTVEFVGGGPRHSTTSGLEARPSSGIRDSRTDRPSPMHSGQGPESRRLNEFHAGASLRIKETSGCLKLMLPPSQPTAADQADILLITGLTKELDWFSNSPPVLACVSTTARWPVDRWL